MRFIVLIVSLGLCCACGTGEALRPSEIPGGTSPVSCETCPAISGVAPASAPAGSADVTLAVTGTRFGQDVRNRPTLVVWTANGESTVLATTFVSSTEITAVIPAELLSRPLTARLWVMDADPMADFHLRPPEGGVLFAVDAPE
ncbi:MAG TPA: IPT/TIG domain-containing protein [Vicinamibacterales bacterium]|nr:IPT/TIG domain-containing protein [Vicinamibacterales bacterium]